MKIEITTGEAHANAGTTVFFVATKSVPGKAAGKTSKKTARSKDEASFVLHGGAKAIGQSLDAARVEKTFLGKAKETIFYRDLDGGGQTLVVGLGATSEISVEGLRMALAAAVKQLRAQKVKTAHFDMDSLTPFFRDQGAMGEAVSEGLILSSYKFLELKTKAKDEPLLPEQACLHFSKKPAKIVEKGLESGQIIAEATNFSRRLGDVPGNLMTPTILGKEASDIAKGTKLKVTVWDRQRIKKENMGSFLGVSLGSEQEPKLIYMEYKGAPASKKPICFVGKGLTFDTGGISIKPAAAMEEMKFDMCGGATVIATMFAIAKLGLKVNAIGVVPSTENMPGPGAIKPGDVLTARNGKTIEVNNTDAEGRLILADALVYAAEQSPEWICDIATLTGAMKMALGDNHTGYFSNHPKFVTQIEKAAAASGEWIWHMPLVPDHVKDMKGVYADLNNISSVGGAGSAKGAAFLSEFVPSEIPWAHFDIAGTAWHIGHRVNYAPDKGASGIMVRTFVELARLAE